MGNVSALRERPFFMSIEFTSVLLCSFVFKIMMGAKKYETFVRSLGEGAPEPKVRLKGRPGQPGLFFVSEVLFHQPQDAPLQAVVLGDGCSLFHVRLADFHRFDVEHPLRTVVPQ